MPEAPAHVDVAKPALTGHIQHGGSKPDRVGARPDQAPVDGEPGPGLMPERRAELGSARPRQRRTITVGETVRSGPAPSRSRESTSTRPSCQSVSPGSSTSKGATATRSASSAGGVARARQSSAAVAAPPTRRPRLVPAASAARLRRWAGSPAQRATRD